MQALKVCPVRPRVLSLAKSLVQLANTFTQSGYGCLKKCLQLSILLHHHLTNSTHFQKFTKKKSWGITLLEKLRAADESQKLETALSSSVHILQQLHYQSIITKGLINGGEAIDCRLSFRCYSSG